MLDKYRLFRMAVLVVAFLLVLVSAHGDSSEEGERFDLYGYSDPFARKVMFPISAAAYALDALTIETCLHNTLGDVTVSNLLKKKYCTELTC